MENVWQFMRDNWLSNRIFKSYEDIVALCCQAWNNLIDQPWKIMSLGCANGRRSMTVGISNLESVVVGMAVNVSKVEGAFVGNLSRTGNLSVNRIIDPIIVVLLNQEFMLFYF